MALPPARRPQPTRRTPPPGRRPASAAPDAPPNPFFIFLTQRRNTLIIAALNLLVFALAMADRYGPLSATTEKVQRVDTFAQEFITDKSQFPIAEEHYFVSSKLIGQDLTVHRTMSGSPLKYTVAGEPAEQTHEPFHHRYSYIELQYLCGAIGLLLLGLRKMKSEVSLFANAMGIVFFMTSVFVLLFN